MCGIMGYIGDENATEIIISGLEELEYRGYDSAGLAVCDGKEFRTAKVVGSPSGLRTEADGIKGKIGIGHTRWATHGAPTVANAHPHTSQSGLFTVVHNGIIENYAELRKELTENGFQFKSDTDTEVIAQMLEHLYNGDLKGTVGAALSRFKGSYALAIMCRDYPDCIVCAKLSSPLFAGVSSDCVYLASDVSAIAAKSDRVFRVNDGEIGLLKKDGLKVFDLDGCRIRKSEIKLKSAERSSDKLGYKHYMLKEIMEQPAAIRRTLSEIIGETGRLKFKGLHMTRAEINALDHVVFVACGSAYHVGAVGAYACEQLFKRHSQAVIASEFRYMHPHLDEKTLVIIISQSGETADTLAAMRIAQEKGANVIGIVNVENSTIAQECKNVVLTKAGQEIAVATTKAYSAQLAVVYALAIRFAEADGAISRREAADLVEELKAIPDKIEAILSEPEKIKPFADTADRSGYICFIGRGVDYCAAMEASLKLKEISYIPCEAYAAGELKHGTISLIDKYSLTVALCCVDELKSKTISNINEVKARNGRTITVSSEGGDITVPDAPDLFMPMLEVIPMQLLAYYTALKRGCPIDKPRNLAKSVTVE
ncbi:MAG TPA: glutamine--fructose-6-phosphate transaminase (isomerizing) [Oscillospiraceae bacterium]|nr:glutamine--fructose-6-phosphate transaminase (isomerizing) [Oscillospiraceae bacterium]